MKRYQFQKEIRELFLQCKFEECIEFGKTLEDKEVDVTSYDYSQIYTGLSYYELNLYSQGDQCFKELIDHKQHQNLGQVKEIDVIIRALWLRQKFDEENSNTFQFNPQLFEVCEQYKSQQQNSSKWNENIFNFGMSMSSFLEDFDKKPDLTYLQKLIDSLEYIIDFRQEIIFIIAWIYDWLDMIDAALNWYQILEKINPNYPGLSSNIGILYFNQGIFDKVEKYYLKSIEINPKSGVQLTLFARYYNKIKEFKKAEELFKKSIQINPKLGNSFYYYGVFLKRNERVEEGLQMMLNGLENDSRNIKILLFLMEHENNNGNDEKCKQYLQRIVEINPHNGVFEYKYGIYKMKNLNNESALEYFNKSLNKKLPQYLERNLHSSLGIIFFRLEEYQKSLDQFLCVCNINFYQINVDNELKYIVSLLNDSNFNLSKNQRIDTINSQFGFIQARFQKIIQHSTDQDIKTALMQKHEQFLTLLSLKAYFTYIQSYLYYMVDLNHWDLFID